MHRHNYGRLFALFMIVALTVAASVGAGGQEKKYRLREIAAVGDISDVDDSMNLRVDLRGSAGGPELPPIEYFRRGRRKYRTTVLPVDKDQRPTAIRRTYSIAREIEAEIGGVATPTVSLLQGKTVTLRRDASGKTLVSVAKGRIGENERKEVSNDLSSTQDDFFPDRDLAIGEEWTLDANRMFESLEGLEKATLRAKFAEVVTYRGHPCARIEMSYTVSGRVPSRSMNIQFTQSGDLYHAIDLQRTLAASVDGPVTLTGQELIDGRTVFFAGDGTMEQEYSERWSKIAGKTTVRKKSK